MTEAATIANAEKALKEFYLQPFDDQFGSKPSVFMEKIKRESLKGSKIVSAAETGLSGGFGFSTEEGETPAAGRVPIEKFVISPADMFVNLVISDKAVKLGGETGSIFPILDTEVKSAYKTANWNTGRALFGDGTGKLATVVSKSGKTIVVDDHKLLKEGLIIDVHAASDAKNAAPAATARIAYVNRKKGTTGYDVLLTGDVPSAVAAAQIITVQKSYKNELTGLGAIFDNSVTSIYGVSKADNPIVKPTSIDANHELSDEVITQVLTDARDYHNSEVDLLLMGNTSYKAYVDYMRTNNYRIETTDGTLRGGFKGIKFLFGNREVEIYNEPFVPDTKIWGVETGKWKFEDTGWTFMQLQGGGIFNLMEDKSMYRATLANYGNPICSNPGGCVEITNCDPTTATTGGNASQGG